MLREGDLSAESRRGVLADQAAISHHLSTLKEAGSRSSAARGADHLLRSARLDHRGHDGFMGKLLAHALAARRAEEEADASARQVEKESKS